MTGLLLIIRRYSKNMSLRYTYCVELHSYYYDKIHYTHLEELYYIEIIFLFGYKIIQENECLAVFPCCLLVSASSSNDGLGFSLCLSLTQ